MNKKGFTLVELLVVVAILGVLAAVGIVSFGGYMSRTKVTAIKNQVNDVAKFIQLKIYFEILIKKTKNFIFFLCLLKYFIKIM